MAELDEHWTTCNIKECVRRRKMMKVVVEKGMGVHWF